MTAVDRFERELPDALADVAGMARPDYLSDILGQTAATRQRPAWASLERWLPMDLVIPRATVARVPWRAAFVLAALLLTIVLAALIAGSRQQRVPPPFGPAANGLISYGANGDIFVGDPITGESHLVVSGPENDYGPMFSPDGTRIMFVRAAPPGEDVYVVNLDGTDVHKLTAAPLVQFMTATWTPRSDGIAVGYGVDPDARFEVLDATGTAAPRLLLSNDDVDWALYRPPAGDELLVRARIGGIWGLYAMRPDGTDVRLLAPQQNAAVGGGPPDQDLNFPAYSPDGTRIYFNWYVPEHETIEAWVMDADGSHRHPFKVAGSSPGWWEGEMVPSPDGRSVIMWRVPPSATAGGGHITVYPADGSGPGREIPLTVSGTAIWGWSPDSTRVLLNYNDDNEGFELLIDPETAAIIHVAWNAHATPDWQRRATP